MRARLLLSLALLLVALGACGPAGDGDMTGGGEEPTSDEYCEPAGCEAYEAECGEIPDGCGGTAECGTCSGELECGGDGAYSCGAEPCEPLACQGGMCGSVTDGCGGVMDCGECEGANECEEGTCVCPGDAMEPNDSAAAAHYLGSWADTEHHSERFNFLTLRGTESDWFSFGARDECCVWNPGVYAIVDLPNPEVAVDVALYYECDQGGDSHSCATGTSTPDSTGCTAYGGSGQVVLELNANCSGIGDGGTAKVRVRRACEGGECFGACESYSLTIGVNEGN